MQNSFHYQSDEYDRQSQRFVIPLYLKDELENFHFSSTGTLAKYQNHHYILFAAHALSTEEDFQKIHMMLANGEFLPIHDLSIGHKVFEKEDVVIVDCFNRRLDSKNYFDLEQKSLLGFDKRHFTWIGFPASLSKIKKIGKTITPAALVNRYFHSDSTGAYLTSAEYYKITSKLITNNAIEITGKYSRKNASLKYKGTVSTAYHPKGMSGGAMFFFTKNQILKPSLEDTFRFAGIGLEYLKDETIRGVPARRIVELLDEFDLANPLQFHLSEDTHQPS
ncbi:hypothetical protein AVMA1855_19890 [Acidovorax sp. SUPP1855]|uniref:hypothetical protein n=1 Tax=Acidovorax sp. SUPP1855 TaxID=431774 RepID=UPI0023DE6732|nr:hypothetical protein [Acidovorax sp. SUPP1855]GKS86452.1 hypothetical protein AVMA1855_19890 [Acidovorax sp. SUPP1855]